MINYKVCLTTKVKPSGAGSGILVIEPEDYTKDEISALKKAGYKVLGYLSIGSVSDERSYYKDLKPYRLSRLEDWEHEWYIDLRRSAVRTWAIMRAREIKALGCDGWWIDNVDVYEYHRHRTMLAGITMTLRNIKALGGYVMVNGGITYLTDMMIPYKVQIGAYSHKDNADRMLKSIKSKGFSPVIVEMDGLFKVQCGAFSSMDNAAKRAEDLHAAGFDTAIVRMSDCAVSSIIDGVTQEEVFSVIKDYDHNVFGTQDKDESERYQQHLIRLRKNGVQTFLLEYTESNTLKFMIKAFCAAEDMTGYYISNDKDL